MEKVGFLKKLEKNRVRQLVVFFVLEALILGIYFVGGKWAKEEGWTQAVNAYSVDVDYNVLAQIEDVSEKGNKIEFSGWAIRLESKNTDIYISLHSDGGTEDIVLLSQCEKRKEIERLINSEWDFGNSGFVADVKKSKLKEDTSYEILLTLSYEDIDGKERKKKISTGKFIRDGQLYSYNPDGFVEPDVKETMVQEVIDKGTVKAYDTEMGAWLYLYDKTLYWIVDYNSIGDLEWRPEVPLFLHTYAIDRLPEKRQQYKKDYVGYYLTEEDYSNGTGDYFIYSYTLPETYPITYIETGLCHNEGDKGWIWKVNVLDVMFNEAE